MKVRGRVGRRLRRWTRIGKSAADCAGERRSGSRPQVVLTLSSSSPSESAFICVICGRLGASAAQLAQADPPSSPSPRSEADGRCPLGVEADGQPRYARPSAAQRQALGSLDSAEGADHIVDRGESIMHDPVDALILDLLEWIGPQPRAYADVMNAWRTSCPGLPVWEDANDRGLVERHHHEGSGTFVSVTPQGQEFLERHRPRGLPPQTFETAKEQFPRDGPNS